jgi:hypothetical protein
VAPNVEAQMGIPASVRRALKRAFGGNLTSAQNQAFGNLWASVANPGEAAQLTIWNSRRLFNNHRNRFWRAARRDAQVLSTLREMGARFPEERTGGPIDPTRQSIPEVELPDGTLIRLSLDHEIERQTAPNRALDPNNLRITTILQNTVELRQLQDQDPFLNPPATWIRLR